MPGSLRIVSVSVLLLVVAAGVASPVVRAEDANGAVEAPATNTATAADGTASVVVPAPESPEPAASLPPAGRDAVTPPPTPPVTAPATVPPPPATVAPPPVTALAEPPAGAAEDLLAVVLEPLPAAGREQPVRPLSLLEALQRPGDPSRRLWIAQAYWKVATAHAWLRWATEAVERLELIAPGGDPHDRAVLDVATAAARADSAEARSQLGVAQQELVDLARLPITDPLPWPVDRPLASPYETHFDAIFATRIATGRTRAIARTLPARHEALEARAAAATAAEKAMAMAEADHAKGKRPIEAVIAAHAALVGQQREFLAAVRAYNLDIAEYAMAVADLSVSDDRFVTMLIGTPSTPGPATPAAAPPLAP